MPPPLSSLCGCRRADLIARFPQSIRFHARSPLQLHWRIKAAVSKAAWWPWPFDLESGVRVFFAVRTVSDWNQLPAVVVEQENPADFKAQLARCAPVRMPWHTTTISVILHEEVCWLMCKNTGRSASILSTWSPQGTRVPETARGRGLQTSYSYDINKYR